MTPEEFFEVTDSMTLEKFVEIITSSVFYRALVIVMTEAAGFLEKDSQGERENEVARELTALIGVLEGKRKELH